MSSREHLIKRVAEALAAEYADNPITRADQAEAAEVVADALLPLIVRPRQLEVGVPDGSILLVEVQAGVRALRWEDGHLHGNLRADGMPMTAEWTIGRYGPLTLVWMP